MSINEKNFFLKNKKINVSNSSSLVNLKAELLKKKKDVNNLKLNKEDFEKINNKNVSNTKWNQKAIQLDQKIRESIQNQKLSKIKPEEDDNLEKELIKSRLNLEKKAKIYDELVKNAYNTLKNKDDIEENQNDLIDFERKVLDSSKNNLDIFVEKNNDKEDLVEYLDSFGRTRFCKKNDLKKIDELNDQDLLRRKLGSDLNELSSSLYDNFVKPKNDEEEDVLKKESHYQNISKNEIREHGTSYYQFSTEEEERKKQMENLDSLRQQTIKQRKKNENVHEKKNEFLKQKLLNLAKRKGLIDQSLSEDQASKIINLDNYIKNDNKEDDDEIDTKKYLNEKYKRNEKKIREWDNDKVYDEEQDIFIIDKKRSYDEDDKNFYDKKKSDDKRKEIDLDKEYYKKRREERNNEFAPPEIYSNKNSRKNEKDVDKFESKIDDFLKFSMSNSKF